ncbi:hypothetical protein ACLOJK_016007 [Asimina triloba]
MAWLLLLLFLRHSFVSSLPSLLLQKQRRRRRPRRTTCCIELMEEAQEILLNSLEGSGISLPTGVSSIQDLNPAALVSICSQSLQLIDDSYAYPTSFPASMAERFKVCTDIAAAVKAVGYRGDLGFHQFLYPSDEDSYKLVRFLVERLSQTSEGRKVTDKKEMVARFHGNEVLVDKVSGSLKDSVEVSDPLNVGQRHQIVNESAPLIACQEKTSSGVAPSEFKDDDIDTLNIRIAEASNAAVQGPFDHRLLEVQIIAGKMDKPPVTEVSSSDSEDSSEKGGQEVYSIVKELLGKSGKLKTIPFVDGESMEQRNDPHDRELESKLASLLEQSAKIKLKVEDLQRQEKMLMEELGSRTSEVQFFEAEHVILKAAVEMAFDGQHPSGFYIEELSKQAEASQKRLLELETQRDSSRRPLEAKKTSLGQSLKEQKPSEREKLMQLEKIELEIKATTAEILRREEEHSKVSVELENLPKIASRKSYIQRVTEITKNNRKQDVDIERILKDTRQLQIESNSIEDRLLRTYAVVDEAVFRDAKNDPVRRQAYRLLTSIHESFQQISEKILATDRTRREAADQEAKLATMASRSFDMDKLEADLDAIRKENELLEQQLRHS